MKDVEERKGEDAIPWVHFTFSWRPPETITVPLKSCSPILILSWTRKVTSKNFEANLCSELFFHFCFMPKDYLQRLNPHSVQNHLSSPGLFNQTVQHISFQTSISHGVFYSVLYQRKVNSYTHIPNNNNNKTMIPWAWESLG